MIPLPIAASPPQEAPSLLVSLMPMVLIFVIFYFIWYMPVRKKQKNLQQLIESLEKGDKVVTTGGIYGEVTRVEGPVVYLKVADKVRLKVAKSAIAGLEGGPEEKGGP